MKDVFPELGKVYWFAFVGSDFWSPMVVHDVREGFVLICWGADDQPLTGNRYVDLLEGREQVWISTSQIAAVIADGDRQS